MEKVGASDDDFCLSCIDYKACTEVSFRHDIKTMLKFVISKAGERLHHRHTEGQKSLQKKSQFWPGDVAG